MPNQVLTQGVGRNDAVSDFSSKPRRIAAEFRVDLPQPRDRLDPHFRDLVEQIYARMIQRAPASVTNPESLVQHGMDRPLPDVSVNSLAGLIEEVEAAPFSGRAPLAAFADTLQLEIDDLFPIIETLQLLQFIDVDDGDAVLTKRGAAFAQETVDQPKANFRRTLESHVRLASHIRKVLDERRSHQAPARRFSDELEDHMSPDFAATTLRAVTEWGRYAKLFAFDDERISLLWKTPPDPIMVSDKEIHSQTSATPIALTALSGIRFSRIQRASFSDSSARPYKP